MTRAWHVLADWVLIPVFHYVAVSVVLAVLEAVGRRLEAIAEEIRRANGMAMQIPVGARMAEMQVQVIRANGTVERTITQRTYRNPILRMGWAIRNAFVR